MTETNKIYKDRTRKNFFKSETDRNLWIKLNAELIRYFNETYNNKPKGEELGDVDAPYSYMSISANQLEYDEYMRDEPRISMEELLTLDFPALVKIAQKIDQETIRRIFMEDPDELTAELGL